MKNEFFAINFDFIDAIIYTLPCKYDHDTIYFMRLK